MQEFTKQLKEKFAYMDYAEYLFISAETGQRIHKIYELVNMIHDNQVMRIKTGVLNEILARATAMKQPPSDKGKRLKLFYITQASVAPPTFVIFVNDRELMHFSYTRYIENQIRENFGFRGTPIRFIIRERGED
jgi:GTP-binding protein